MKQAARHRRQQKGAGHAQAHGPPPVEGQNVTGQQQHGRHEPEAVAQKTPQKAAEKRDEHRIHMEISEGGKECQKQADYRPYLPADRPGHGRRGLIFPAAGFAPAFCLWGGAFPGRALSGGFLLCGGHERSPFPEQTEFRRKCRLSKPGRP
ncbi:hypothetical protein SDC9_192408 [bioreactor metagenome]|uniref:Uncharacterized protein n=1 Tax=bioreactor metagenome TaxID=1076179 RepID=A0A645I0M5_9ZZZZ